MSDNAPLAQSKSAVDKMRGITFAKREYQFTPGQYHSIKTLEQDRRDTQDEISKLTLILEDEKIELDDMEVMEVNDEINRLIEMKRQIEIELHSVSDGKISYGPFAGPSTLFKYFGRAKELKRKQDEEEARKTESEKRKVFEITDVTETDKAEVVKEALAKHGKGPAKAKRTRFDDDDEE